MPLLPHPHTPTPLGRPTTDVFKALAAWGFTPRAALLDALEQHCVQGVGARAFGARQLAMLAWAYAQLGLKQRWAGGRVGGRAGGHGGRGRRGGALGWEPRLVWTSGGQPGRRVRLGGSGAGPSPGAGAGEPPSRPQLHPTAPCPAPHIPSGRPLLSVILAAAEEEFRSPEGAAACPPEAMADLIWAAARLQVRPSPRHAAALQPRRLAAHAQAAAGLPPALRARSPGCCPPSPAPRPQQP